MGKRASGVLQPIEYLEPHLANAAGVLHLAFIFTEGKPNFAGWCLYKVKGGIAMCLWGCISLPERLFCCW